MKNAKKGGNKKPKLKLRKNDLVQVITGNDREEKITGRILAIDPVKMTVVVEGANIRKRHQRPTQEHPEGTILEREMPIHYSNVQLVADNGKPTRLGSRVEENGSKTRIARSTGSEV